MWIPVCKKTVCQLAGGTTTVTFRTHVVLTSTYERCRTTAAIFNVSSLKMPLQLYQLLNCDSVWLCHLFCPTQQKPFYKLPLRAGTHYQGKSKSSRSINNWLPSLQVGSGLKGLSWDIITFSKKGSCCHQSLFSGIYSFHCLPVASV